MNFLRHATSLVYVKTGKTHQPFTGRYFVSYTEKQFTKRVYAVLSCKAEYIGGNSFLICVLNGEKGVSRIMKGQFHWKRTFLTQWTRQKQMKRRYVCVIPIIRVVCLHWGRKTLSKTKDNSNLLLIWRHQKHAWMIYWWFLHVTFPAMAFTLKGPCCWPPHGVWME